MQINLSKRIFSVFGFFAILIILFSTPTEVKAESSLSNAYNTYIVEPGVFAIETLNDMFSTLTGGGVDLLANTAAADTDSYFFTDYVIDPLADFFYYLFDFSVDVEVINPTPVSNVTYTPPVPSEPIPTPTEIPEPTPTPAPITTTTTPPVLNYYTTTTSGEQGATGERGPAGPQGPQGIQGPRGPAGADADTSNFVSDASFNNQVDGILDSIDDGISSVNESIGEGVSTDSLVVSGDTTISGNLTVAGTMTGTIVGNAGTATALQTARSIYGNNFDGTANLAQIIASTFGGTGNGFTKFTGPTTAEKTFTLPDSSATLLYSGGDLGTPSSGVATNLTGTASGLTAGNVTTNANLTGVVTSIGNATSIADAALSIAKTSGLQSALDLKSPLASPTFTGTVTIPSPFTLGATSVTSTGTQLNYLNAATGTTGTTSTNLVFSTSPTLVTPILGTPASVTLTNATGLPASAVLAGTFGTGAYVMDTSLTVPTINGSTAANGDITINGTSDATKTTSYVNLQTTGGNVGIGTTAPDKALEINSATGANLRLTYNDADGSAANYSDFTVGSTGGLTLTAAGTNPKTLVVNNGSSTGNIFEAQDGGTAVFTIVDGGKVGVGTTTPTNDLSFGGSSARKIWVEKSTTTTAGKNLTIAAGSTDGENDFTALDQAGRLWYALAAAPNGNVYGAVTYGSDRDIYMQTGGTGDFIALNQGLKAWYGIAVAPNGDVYASENGGDIYKQTGGTGNFVALGQTTRNYGGMAVTPGGDVYVTVLNGDIYKQTGGTGNFVALGQTSRVWYGIAAAPNGDVYASVFGGDIYKQTGGTGNFVALGQTTRNWYSMTADPSGNIYAVSYTGGNIYKQTGGTGNFVSLNQTTRTWVGLAAASNGNIYASVEGGDIYMQTYSVGGGTADLASGKLILSAGQGKGLGASTISFLTGTPVASGTMLQSLSEKMTILGNGNIGIGTIAPTGNLAITQTATATGALKGIVYTGAVNTNQTLSTEIPSLTLTTAGRQWAAGALATQREVLITQPTYSFVGASTITNAATMGIAGAPIASTNATLTNSHGLLIQAGAVGAGTTNSYGLTVNAQTGATNNYAAQFMGGNVGIGSTAPDKALEINSATGANMRLTYNDADGSAANYADLSTSSIGGLTITSAGTNPKTLVVNNNSASSTGNILEVQDNSSAVFTVADGGNVGIGTTAAPSSKLHLLVDDAINNDSVNLLRLVHTTSGTAANNIGAGILFQSEDTTGTLENMGQISSIFSNATHGNETSALLFYNRSGASALTEKMRLNGDGGLGVNTTASTGQLEILNTTTYSSGIKLTSTSNHGGSIFYGLNIDRTSGTASTAYGVYSSVAGATNNRGGYFSAVNTATTGVVEMLSLVNLTSGTATNDIGTSLGFYTEDTNGSTELAGSISGILTNATHGAEAGALVLSSRGAEGIRIINNGNVGIGTPSPGSNKLNVQGDVAAPITYLFNDGNATTREGLEIQVGADDASGTNTALRFKDGDGTTQGTITFSGGTTAYNTSSDRRLKSNIVDTSFGLEELMNIEVKDFNFISDTENKLRTGFIAQDLYNIFPDIVTVPTNANDMWSVDYGKLTPLLTKSIQELNLNLNAISGTVTPESESFVTAFFENLFTKVTTWLADASNGIGDLFADKVYTKELCVTKSNGEDFCVTGDQLEDLVGAGEGSSGSGGGDEPAPDSTSSPQAEPLVPSEPVEGDPETTPTGDEPTTGEVEVVIEEEVPTEPAPEESVPETTPETI